MPASLTLAYLHENANELLRYKVTLAILQTFGIRIFTA